MMNYDEVIAYLTEHDDDSEKMKFIIEFIKYQQQVNNELEDDFMKAKDTILYIQSLVQNWNY